MKHLILILMFFSSIAAIAQTGGKNFIDLHYIEVTGKAEMEIAPDNIFIGIQINEKDFKGKTSADIEKSMYSKLDELALNPGENLKVKDLASNFRNYWFNKADVQLLKEYQLLVKDGKTAGAVFLELQKLGISNVSISRIENSMVSDYRRQVKIAAMKAAQEKAKDLTQAIGQDIGPAIYVQEIETPVKYTNATSSNILIKGTSSSNIYGSSAPAPEIEFEKIRLEYSIVVRFELK